MTDVYEQLPLEIMGEHPPTQTISPARHAALQEFTALVAHEVRVGRVSSDVGNAAIGNFIDYLGEGRVRNAHTSPNFYR